MLDGLWEEIKDEYTNLNFADIRQWYDLKVTQSRYDLEEGSCEKENAEREIECNFYQRAATVLTKPVEDQMISILNWENRRNQLAIEYGLIDQCITRKENALTPDEQL